MMHITIMVRNSTIQSNDMSSKVTDYRIIQNLFDSSFESNLQIKETRLD